jgi:hypothetical protein
MAMNLSETKGGLPMQMPQPEFPYVASVVFEDGFGAFLGLRLQSILKAELLSGSNDGSGYAADRKRLESRFFFKSKQSFINAVAALPEDVILELHLAAMQDLCLRPQGELQISLLIKTLSESQEKAREKAMSAYLGLVPSLRSHFPEMDFRPITAESELRRRVEPFVPKEAVSICRCAETIALTAPLKRAQIGFGSVEETLTQGPLDVDHLFPWVPNEDSTSVMMETLMGRLDPVQVIIRLRRGKTGEKGVDRLERLIRTCDEFLSGNRDSQLTLRKQAQMLRDISMLQLANLGGLSLDVAVFIRTPGKADRLLATVVGSAVSGPRYLVGEKQMYRGGFHIRPAELEDIADWAWFPEEEPSTLWEAAGAFLLPIAPSGNRTGLPVRHSRTSPAELPASLSSGEDSIVLFENEHQGFQFPVRLGVEDRFRHVFVMGMTGTGKSTFLENMIVQDIVDGRGLALIDPHGDLVDSVIAKIPARRSEDVVLFDLLDREMPFGFNILEWNTIEERDLIIDELYQTVDRLYDLRTTGGPIFELHFRGILRLLMGDRPRSGFVPTLLEFSLCYLDADFRKWLLKAVDDPQIKDFVKEMVRASGDARLENVAPYITSKLNRFLGDTMLRRVVGQSKTSFDFEKIINEGKIFLVKLGKGRFGPVVSSLITNQLVSRFKLAAMKRQELEHSKRRPFFLYVDEAHNLASDNFMELLSEARKYRLGLVLATQYSAQLTDSLPGRSNNLMSAILGNVGTIVLFRVGQEDAPKIGMAFNPHFSALDIIGLPNWNGYARMQAGGAAVPPFSFKTIKDETRPNAKRAERIERYSRFVYGTDAGVVDAIINRRREDWKAELAGVPKEA